MKIELKPVSCDRYWEMLGCVPPALHLYDGFLVGDPYDLRTCAVTGKMTNTYHAYFGRGLNDADEHFVAVQPLTVAEFRQAIALRREGRLLEIIKEAAAA